MSLGRTIRKLRQSKRWTQGHLAAYSHIDQSYLSKIERDKHKHVSVQIVAKLAKTLDVSLDYLLEQAGLLPTRLRYKRDQLSSYEQELVKMIRQIPTEQVRHRTAELLTQVAIVARDLDVQRAEVQYRKAAEEREEYEAKEEE